MHDSTHQLVNSASSLSSAATEAEQDDAGKERKKEKEKKSNWILQEFETWHQLSSLAEYGNQGVEKSKEREHSVALSRT